MVILCFIDSEPKCMTYGALGVNLDRELPQLFLKLTYSLDSGNENKLPIFVWYDNLVCIPYYFV